MSSDLEKGIGQALSEAIAGMLLGGDNRTDRGYLSLVRGGYPVNGDFFDFLSATPFRFHGGTEAAGKMAQHAAAFASLVDAIPRAVGDWMRTGASLDVFYRDTWLPFIDVPTARLSPATMAAYAKARKALGHNDAADEAAIAELEKTASQLDAQAAAESDPLKKLAREDAADKVRAKIQAILDRPKKLYTEYATHRNRYQKAVADLNLQMNTDPGDDLQIRTRRDAVSNALDEWQALGNKARYEQALATVARVESTDLSKTVEGLKKRFDAVKQLNDASANPFVPVGLIPPNFHEERGTWTSVSFNNQRLRDTSSYQHTISSSGSGPGLFWRSDGETSDTTTRVVTNASQKMTVSFEIARVAIDRSAWFDASLLTSRMWKWADGAAGRPLSDGKVSPGPDENLALPMYATDIVVARNVRVTLAMTQSESSSFHQEITRASRHGFWIFGSSSQETTTTDRSTFEWSAGTATLAFPGMQIVGFLCDRLPKLPDPSF